MTADPVGVLVLLALVPAWVYLSQRRRHVPAGSRTSLSELLELVVLATVTTGAAALAALVWAAAGLPGGISLTSWAHGGNSYLVAHPLLTVLNFAAVLSGAALIALAACAFRYRGVPEHHGDGDVWWAAFNPRPKGKWHYVGVMLDDGTLIEGLLISFGTEVARTGDKRDVALKSPIRMTAPGKQSMDQAVDRIVLPERVIRYVTSVHADLTTKPVAQDPGRREPVAVADDQSR